MNCTVSCLPAFVLTRLRPNDCCSGRHRAAAAVQSALPDHKIIGIKLGREILLGGGNVHCITQQQPV